MLLKIDPCLFVAQTEHKGRGVFTRKKIPPRKIIEISSVLVMDEQARILLDQTGLYNYIFEWGEHQCAVAWGYVSLYNHSYHSNCEYFMDYDHHTISIQTVRAILPGEELTINYNGDWNDEKAIWFEVL